MALVLFDLNGTLLDPGDRLPVLDRAVQLAMAHSLAGDFRPFGSLLQAAGGPPDEMPPFPDVAPALERLSAEGHRLGVVTNSERATGEEHLRRARLADGFERVVGTDEIGAYKPDRRVYRYAVEQLGGADDAWLVAAHDWDLVGAHSAGLHTVFVDRGLPAPATIEPDRSVATLAELVI